MPHIFHQAIDFIKGNPFQLESQVEKLKVSLRANLVSYISASLS